MQRILADIFEVIVRKRNKRYDSGYSEIVDPGVPVISIGNISAGGTGKTPFTRLLACELIERGYMPVIIGRGYKRKSKGEVVVSDGINILSTPSESGDEMYMLASLVACPVVVNDEKSEAALTATEMFNPDVILVDDGFQHRKLHRDTDIVLVDKKSVDYPYLLPKGRLREPLSSLDRADIICLTDRSISICEIKGCIRPGALVIRSQTLPGKPYDLFDTFKANIEQTGSYIAVSGIAHPERFRDMLKQEGYNVKRHIYYGDHHNYTIKDLSRIISKCRTEGINHIMTTEKDSAKLRDFKEIFESNKINCHVFPIFTEIIEGKELLIQKAIELINEKRINKKRPGQK